MDASTSAGADHSESDPVAPAAGELLHLSTAEPLPGVLVLTVAGEVDMITQAAFLDATMAAMAAADTCVVVDLAGVTYMGSSGLAVLAQAHEQARDSGVGFCVAAASKSARRVLELTGLDVAIGHCDTVAEALAELR